MRGTRCAVLVAFLVTARAFYLSADDSVSEPETAQTPRPESREEIRRPGWVPLVREDFKNLMVPENVAILRLGAGAGVLSHPYDRELTRRAAESGTAGSFFSGGSSLGNGALHGSAALAAYAFGRLNHKPRVERLGEELIRAQFMNGVLTGGIKLAADRTRPDGRSHSLPSGHTSAAFASAVVLQKHCGWKVGVPAFAAAAYVGGSRIADNHHYLSDVLFGAALGIVAGRTVTLGSDESPFSIYPQWMPGGLGVTIELPPWRSR